MGRKMRVKVYILFFLWYVLFFSLCYNCVYLFSFFFLYRKLFKVSDCFVFYFDVIKVFSIVFYIW